MAKVGAAFIAGALLTYLVGDAILRKRDAMLRNGSHLHERVRLRVAQLVTQPDAVEIHVDEGLVRVSGRVLPGELDGLLSQLTRVPGVHRVYNALATAETKP
jgi:hypothetical protein